MRAQRGCEQFSDDAGGIARWGGRDHQHITGVALLDGHVDHQVVGPWAEHGHRRAGKTDALLDRTDGGVEQPGSAVRLVGRGDAVGGEGGHGFGRLRHHRPLAVRHQAGDATTVLRSVPIPSISDSMTSPGCRYSGGVRAKPTPSGVPVAISMPGSRVMPIESHSMIASTG